MRFRRLLGALVYLVFLALFVEGALQLFYRITAGDFLFSRTGLPIYAAEPWTGLGNRRDYELDHHTSEFHAHYYNNHEGFRVPRPGLEYARAKPPGTLRVMLLGPSFTYGWGVDYEASFAGVLERLLAEGGFAGAQKLELINAGVPSVGSQLEWFEHVGVEYQPDLVIQFVYGSMAVSNRRKSDLVVDDEGYLLPRQQEHGAWLREQLKKSATIFYGWILWTKLDALRGGAAEQGGAVLGAGRPLEQSARFDPADARVQEAQAFYDELASRVRAAGAELLVVYFPLSYAIHPEDMSRWRLLGVHDVSSQMAFDAAFVRHLNERGIPTLDITESLRQAASRGERLYFWLDIHWTKEGNQVAAQAVAEHLLAQRQQDRPASR